MHKYQLSTAVVLPIATDDATGNSEATGGTVNLDQGSKSTSSKLSGAKLPGALDSKGSSSFGVAFIPHQQTLQPIPSSQSLDIMTNGDPDTQEVFGGSETVTKSSVAAQQQKKSRKQGSGSPLRRATVDISGESGKKQRLPRKRSASLESSKIMELTKNYDQLVREFKMLRPFTRSPDGSYPRDTKCAICRRARPSAVFFPCQHRCVCDDCIASHHISADRANPNNWCACPVCMTDICLILAHSGKEEEKYWKWVMEVQPRLSSQFRQEFKEAGRRLQMGIATTTSREEEGSTMLQAGGAPKSRRLSQQQSLQLTDKATRAPGKVARDSTCSIL